MIPVQPGQAERCPPEKACCVNSKAIWGMGATEGENEQQEQ